MGPFDMLQISGSALSAERQRSEVIATNMANAETTHTDSGGPFRRKEVVFASSSNASFHLAFASASQPGRTPGTVRISQVVDDQAPPVMRYEPGHPDANAEGVCGIPRNQSSAGDGGPDGFHAGVSVERFRRECGQADDSAVDRHSEELTNNVDARRVT